MKTAMWLIIFVIYSISFNVYGKMSSEQSQQLSDAISERDTKTVQKLINEVTLSANDYELMADKEESLLYLAAEAAKDGNPTRKNTEIIALIAKDMNRASAKLEIDIFDVPLSIHIINSYKNSYTAILALTTLAKSGYDLNHSMIIPGKNQALESVLTSAIHKGFNVAQINKLIELGADPNAALYKNATLLHEAAWGCNEELVHYFLTQQKFNFPAKATAIDRAAGTSKQSVEHIVLTRMGSMNARIQEKDRNELDNLGKIQNTTNQLFKLSYESEMAKCAETYKKIMTNSF